MDEVAAELSLIIGSVDIS